MELTESERQFFHQFLLQHNVTDDDYDVFWRQLERTVKSAYDDGYNVANWERAQEEAG